MNKQAETQSYHRPHSHRCATTKERCATCSDQALPARVLSVNHARKSALVEIEQMTEEIDVSLIGDVEPGDTLLVHGGIAFSLWH